ncbi:hypothetical protein P692DRAFT_20880256 [Suillus brevipes Sb2]|nr:hypothetical protein P692DRAFT_20880256 [Suillus brevipes Sb2]
MSKRAASDDDTPSAKRMRTDEGSQTAPLNDEHAWRIMEDFLTTDMTYPKMEEVFLSYLGDRYAEGEWKEARDALFSGDGDDNVALENLRAVKAKHISISPASCAPKDHPVTDRRLSQARVRPTRRPAKSKNPYLDLYAGEDNEEEEEEEEEEEDSADESRSKSRSVTCLPGSSSATRFAAVIDGLANRIEDTRCNASQDHRPLPPISELITSALSQDGRMYLVHVHRNVTDFIA